MYGQRWRTSSKQERLHTTPSVSAFSADIGYRDVYTDFIIPHSETQEGRAQERARAFGEEARW
jgi:hypothetical protein